MQILLWLVSSLVIAVALVGAGLALFTASVARRVEAALPPLGCFIDVGGTRMHYLDVGSGPAIVMIHGLAGQMRHFTYGVVDRLRSRFRVIVLDRPGSGYTRRPDGQSARLATQADTIAAFMTALALDKPLVVGHSLGGALALAIALDHPESVGGLALVAPLTKTQAAPPSLFRGLAIASPFRRRLTAWTLATPFSIRNAPRTLATLFGPDPIPPDYGDKAGGMLGLRPSMFFGASSDLVAVNDDLPGMTMRYASLSLPIGVLFGTGDKVLSGAENGQTLADTIPGVDLEWVDGGGHMIPMSSPDRTARFIERMAARVFDATPFQQPLKAESV